MNKSFLSVSILAFLLSACGKPIPPDKQNYVGEWRSKEMYLLIMENGRVKYKRQTRFATTEITGPIKEFQGDHFVVGFAFVKTRFEVSKPPHQEDGGWSMVVDGVRLTRRDAFEIYEPRIERDYDDIVKSVFLGQIYPSGNIYLRTFDEITEDSYF